MGSLIMDLGWAPKTSPYLILWASPMGQLDLKLGLGSKNKPKSNASMGGLKKTSSSPTRPAWLHHSHNPSATAAMERGATAAVFAFLSTNSHPLLLLRRYPDIHPEDIAESLLRRRSGIPGILADGSERSSTLFASLSRRETMTMTLTLGARGATGTLASRGGEELDFRGDGYGKMGIHVDVAGGSHASFSCM